MTSFALEGQDSSRPEPQPVTFIFPRKDLELRDWMRAAAELLTRDPARYMLAAEQTAPLIPLACAFDEALMLTYAPGTRCQQATRDKDDAREAARAAFKPIVDHIRHHAAIDILDKVALGMKATIRQRRTPIEPPNSAPMLNITAAGADGTHTLRYADETTPTKRRRPKEAGYLDLRIIAAPITIGIWPNPESTAEALAAAGVFVRSERITKSPFTIQHDRAHAGRCTEPVDPSALSEKMRQVRDGSRDDPDCLGPKVPEQCEVNRLEDRPRAASDPSSRTRGCSPE